MEAGISFCSRIWIFFLQLEFAFSNCSRNIIIRQHFLILPQCCPQLSWVTYLNFASNYTNKYYFKYMLYKLLSISAFLGRETSLVFFPHLPVEGVEQVGEKDYKLRAGPRVKYLLSSKNIFQSIVCIHNSKSMNRSLYLHGTQLVFIFSVRS